MMITDPAALRQILHAAQILYLAFRAEPAPYVVPVCFGAEGDLLYFHGGTEGRKLDLLRTDPRVGFSACTEAAIRPGPDACAFTISAASVVGTGRARIVEDEAERVRGLDAIMRHYDPGFSEALAGDEGGGRARYRPGSLSRTRVIAIHVESLSGKRTGPAG